MAIINVQVDQEAAAKAASGEYTLRPEGKYRLRVESKEWEPPKDATKYANLKCKCTILNSFNGQNLGKSVTRRFSMSPKSIPYNLQRFLQAAGIAYQMQNGSIMFDDDHVPGATTDVTCKHSVGESRTFENWDNDEPVGGQQTQQAAPMQQPQQQPWAPPAQQQPMQQPTQAFPPQQGWTPPGAPQQQFAPPQQPAQPPQNGGAPPWMQQQPQQPTYPQGAHLAGQGPMPPRGQG